MRISLRLLYYLFDGKYMVASIGVFTDCVVIPQYLPERLVTWILLDRLMQSAGRGEDTTIGDWWQL